MLIQAEALSREKLLMLLIILSRGVLSRYHVQADALLKGCYYCDPVDALSQSNSTTALTDRCYLLRSFFNEIRLFGPVLLLNHQDCFLFHCEWYEMKQCLVPCLLSSNSQQSMTICLLLIEYSIRSYIDEYDRNGVFENLIL